MILALISVLILHGPALEIRLDFLSVSARMF